MSFNRHIDEALRGAPPPERVGPLGGRVWLTLQTRAAVRLFTGRADLRARGAMIGLLGFAERLRIVWEASRDDDPYADWWLVKIEDVIAACHGALARAQEQADELLDSVNGLSAEVAESSAPARIPLRFTNPYAFRAARLLADFDAYTQTMLTVRHLGIDMPSGLGAVHRGVGRQLRGLFVAAHDYHRLGIDRKAVAARTRRALEAREAMGELPKDVLSGERLPSMRPPAAKKGGPSG